MRNPFIRSQRGVHAVELALVLPLFLLIIYGVMELARAMYLINTLEEVTRRAARTAAVTDFKDDGKMDTVRFNAVFRDDAGSLRFGQPVTDKHVTIDYLALTRDASGKLEMTPIPTGSLPSCPRNNRKICMANANDASCIRFVRVRICAPGSGSTCDPVPYEPVVSLVSLPFNLPPATTIVPAESLGYPMDGSPCF